ncbi:rRNA pseudouridine synthase [Clostridium sp. CM028]|uniref:pseudouridine synthase n=1 Tax=unclassified Clostridium TaxID=2614128 RepID=UPI001C0D2229|nr:MULTISPECIES: pseudouridine synthase [unclassified Clostridium]MBU3092215.1 rRNA pseudouridine synthase [Clostridium sp. CF011]MBW9144032.1 rRNA pseudouridine synthase [Clostridium sp. CM027]MBW9147657.1 rRNA pseudouridine synthase [Clostridium sp. CM028]UVE42585.1 rRNA pseudouridine synthase [Clostridium sp. CM027]WAG71539.1 rRNA pseudouridine synthase [Clostridium sp. CF011]
MEERLQKFMASCGVASRRKCEEIITAGRVKVNDLMVTELGHKVDPEKDRVHVDNKIINMEENKVYIALNKPEGIVSTVKDEKERKTILDLVKVKERIYPIGRLDYDTCGLIILTNDGDIYNKVIHPRQAINKVYLAILEGCPNEEEISKFCNGIDIEGYITAKADLQINKRVGFNCRVTITIHEGKNRQIRKMCDAIGHPVIALKRVSVGNILLGDMEKGSWRNLTEDEIKYLKNL